MADRKRTLHCWMGKSVHIEKTFGFHSEQHIETYMDDFVDGTCMLEAGHDGPHEFTPNSQIGVTFSGERPSRLKPMTDPKAALILCSRLSDPERRAVPGAELRNCADCGAEVIIAPSTLARPELSNPSTRIVCLECGAPQLDGLVLYPPNEQQKDELEAAGYDRESWPLRHAHGSVLKKVDFMPGDVVLHPLPLVGTMGRSELEVAAAMLVFALKTKAIGWQPITMDEVQKVLLDHLNEDPVASWTQNPFLSPDFLGLVERGFARRADHPDSIVFTLRGIEALRPHVKRPEVPNG